nr:ISL3 family transposase [Ktedonobacteraceae bacterium]
MEGASLLALPEGMQIEQIQITETGLEIQVAATASTSSCPLCSEISSSIHCHYQRTLRDAPCAGRRVQLLLTVRKFTCRNPYCERKVFTERLPDFVEPWARTTLRFCQQITSIGLATCGKGGKKLAARLGMQTSRNTILRRIMELPDPSLRSVVFLGIDDFAFRRGYRFGTILVNLESHRVVDLLPDRQAETAAQWMRQQPDLAVISRDRGGEYASAAREGAPQAIQCADRFHIVKNLTEAFQVLLARCQAEILAETKPDEPDQSEQNKPIISIEEWRPPEPAHVEKVRLARRAGRYARYQQVVELSRQGVASKEIAGRVGLSDRTVRDWLKQGAFPEAQKRRKKQSSFDPFAAYVLKRWQDGEHNGLVLWQEIKKQGYTGTDRSVYRYLKTLKQAEVRTSLHPERLQKYSVNAAIWLFVRDPNKLEEIEQEDLVAFCQASAPLKKAYEILQDFLSIVHQREGQRLDAWLTRVAESGLPELQSFATGVERDKDAVKAGLTWPINNGMVEGHVTKLKLIKRTMYGRAGFALLRQRVLHAV